ncbi:divergent polysaccharide deacetylase family protein [Roseovarius albus]|nr:divergent polysaccharide deacetylase family protein [Roseovarius albus]
MKAKSEAKTLGQGFFAGILSGTVVSGLAVGGMSLLAGAPEARVETVIDLNVPEYSGFAQSAEQVDVEIQAQVEEPATTLSGVSTVPDSLSAISESITQSADQPEAESFDLSLVNPETQDAPLVGATADEPISKTPEAGAVEVPESEGEVSLSTEPAQPLSPALAEEESVFAEPADVVEPESVVEEEQIAAVVIPESSGTIDNIADGVTTDRLPSITTPEDEGAVLGAAPDVDSSAFGDDSAVSALERFASDFDNPDDKPLMAIVLVVERASSLDITALEDFPYPLSFAIDVTNPDAAAMSERIRAAGHEVLAQIDLPAEADAKGTEEAMQIYMKAVPEAVAVIEGLNTGVQSNRAASKQLAPILRDSGHGAVLLSNGLNTAQKLIAREGVPSASVFRDFDSQGQSERTIRRFLDQGAFRAGQEKEGVIMMGRLRPETAKALVVWALEDRAGLVALAPVSAVLSADQTRLAIGQ